MGSDDPPDERVIYSERFQGEQFDFQGKSIFTRYEQLAFTTCVFKDCNIEKLEPDEVRGLYVVDNLFDRPLEQRRADFEVRLAQAMAGRKAKEK
jgi:hypothetical protein